MNDKEIALYDLVELVTGEQWFTTGDPQTKRLAFRQVYEFGPIAAGALLLIPHNISGVNVTTTFTHIYGTAFTTLPDNRPIPFASATLVTDQIQITVGGTNIRIVNGTTSQSKGGSSMGGGSPRGYDTFSTFSPQQEQAFNQLLSQLSGKGQGEFANQSQSFLQNILGGDTSQFEAPLMRQFQEQTIPGLAERFSGAGAGAQSSSAFQNALGGAGADLAERLGSLRGSLQLGAAQQGLGQGQQNMNSLQNLLGMSTRGYVPQQKGFMESALPGLLQALLGAGGTALGGYLGRPR